MLVRRFAEGVVAITRSMLYASIPLAAAYLGLAVLGSFLSGQEFSLVPVLLAALKSYAIVMAVIFSVALIVFIIMLVASWRR